MDGYIINQSTHTTSTDMISVNTGVESRINQIHNATHLYVGELVNGVLQCKQLSDANKTLYADGTSLVIGENQDVFMKLPQFWWKSTPDPNNEDICEINFTMTDPEDASWFEWEGNTFIGAYKGYVENSKLYSRSGVSVAYTRTNLNNYRNYARARGAGYTCLTYEMMQMIALLGFGRLKALNPRAAGYSFGFNQSNTITTGNCDSLGMTDGKSGTSSNFFGMENFITGSGQSEYIDNITRDTDTFNILDSSLSVSRSVSCTSYYSGNYFCTKILLGQYGDIFPKEVTSTNPGNTNGYGGGVNISKQSFIHSNNINSVNTSFVSLQATGNASATINYITSRLQYKGNYIIIT